MSEILQVTTRFAPTPNNKEIQLVAVALPWMAVECLGITGYKSYSKYAGVCGCCGAIAGSAHDVLNNYCMGFSIGLDIDQSQLKPEDANYRYDHFKFPDGTVMTIKISKLEDTDRKMK